MSLSEVHRRALQVQHLEGSLPEEGRQFNAFNYLPVRLVGFTEPDLKQRDIDLEDLRQLMPELTKRAMFSMFRPHELLEVYDLNRPVFGIVGGIVDPGFESEESQINPHFELVNLSPERKNFKVIGWSGQHTVENGKNYGLGYSLVEMQGWLQNSGLGLLRVSLEKGVYQAQALKVK